MAEKKKKTERGLTMNEAFGRIHELKPKSRVQAKFESKPIPEKGDRDVIRKH